MTEATPNLTRAAAITRPSEVIQNICCFLWTKKSPPRMFPGRAVSC